MHSIREPVEEVCTFELFKRVPYEEQLDAYGFRMFKEFLQGRAEDGVPMIDFQKSNNGVNVFSEQGMMGERYHCVLVDYSSTKEKFLFITKDDRWNELVKFWEDSIEPKG